jgi:uncharacterized protein (DUF2384 family)
MTTSFDDCRKRLVATVRRIVTDSGDPTGFDARAWTDDWLDRPVPALGGVTPREYILSGQDCQDVVNILLRMQSGAFS